MQLIVEWGIPMKVSRRIYNKGSINLGCIGKNLKSDIILINLQDEKQKIGECNIIENEIGLFANNIKYFINSDILMSLLKELKDADTKFEGCTYELSMVGFGNTREEYTKEFPIEFRYLVHQLYTKDNFESIVRDLKLKSIEV